MPANTSKKARHNVSAAKKGTAKALRKPAGAQADATSRKALVRSDEGGGPKQSAEALKQVRAGFDFRGGWPSYAADLLALVSEHSMAL